MRTCSSWIALKTVIAARFCRFFALNGGEAPFQALVYIAELELDVPLPNAEYKRLILEGAKHWKLPSLYLSIIEEIEAVG